MRTISKIFLLVLLQLSFSVQAAVIAVQVSVDAEVFAKPNLKSKVIEKLTAGTVISMKTDKVVGEGGFGVFYKVRTPSRKIGYVVDSDIAMTGGKPLPVAPPPAPKEPQREPEPVVEKTVRETPDGAWGVSLGAANYSGEFAGKKHSATQMFFGGRWSRNSGILRHDAGILLSPNAPKFLSAAGASGKTSGFILLGDFSWNYHYFETSAFSLYVGAGPLLGYSSFSTNLNNETKKDSQFKFGGVADLGASVDFETGRARLDIRYFVEKSSYIGGFFTVQLFL